MNVPATSWTWGDIFALTQTLAIIVTLGITIFTVARNSKIIKTSNTLLINQHHREIWTATIITNKLKRVYNMDVNIAKKPVTDEEFMFVNMVFLHMSACLKLMREKACFPIEGIERDIKDIMRYPIFQYVWSDVWKFHDRHFVEFVLRYGN